MPLRITDAQKDVSSLNKWAKGMEDDVARLHHESRAHFRTQNSLAASVAATAAISATPANPTGTSGSSAAITIDGQVYCQVTINYTAPATLGSFGGVFLAVKNYNGSTQLVKASEDNFTGAGGGSQLFKTILNRTGEVITCYVVPKTIGEATVADWTTAPSFTLTLDGSVTAPAAPSGLAVTAQPLANTLAWTGNSEGNMQGYTVYRNTVNVFGSATKLGTVPWVANGVPHFVDKTGTVGVLYYYFITATNNATLESGASASVSVTVIAANLDTHVTDGGTFVRMNGPPAISAASSTLLTQSGTTKTIIIAANTHYFGNLTLNANSGSVTVANYAVKYFVYFDTTSSYASGAQTYVGTANVVDTAQNPYRVFVGSIIPFVGGGGSGGGVGGGCFSGNVRVRTPDGSLRFDEMPIDEWFPVFNENGPVLAKLIVHDDWHEQMIDMGDGELVTFGHLIQEENGYVPAIKTQRFKDAPTREFTGTVYNLKVDHKSHHYVLANGVVAHNSKPV